MRRLMSILLALTLLLGCCNMFVSASAAEIEDNVSPCEWMSLTSTTTVTYGSGYKVKISIPYIISTDLSNASSFRIASISTGTVTNVSGWYAVESSLKVNSTTYYDNSQKAVLNVTYKASIGAGYEEYNTVITITVPNYSG